MGAALVACHTSCDQHRAPVRKAVAGTNEARPERTTVKPESEPSPPELQPIEIQQLEEKTTASEAIQGTVLDCNGLPVEDALVGCTALNGFSTTTRTNAIGEFRFENLPRTDLRVAAAHREFVARPEITVRLGTQPIERPTLQFPSGTDFHVLVGDERGEPIPGCDLRFEFQTGAHQLLELKTDTSGTAVARCVPYERIDRLSVSAFGYASFEARNVDIANSPYSIQLTRRSHISVALDPVPSAASESQMHLALYRSADPTSSTSAAINKMYVAFQQTQLVHGHAVFSNLEAGNYKVGLSFPNGYIESGSIILSADRTGNLDTTVTLGWNRTGAISGHILDVNTSRPLPGISVTARPKVQSEFALQARSAQSDRDGNFEIRNVAGQFELCANSDSYGEVCRPVNIKAGSTETLDLQLSDQRFSLSGRVSMVDKPLNGALLVLNRSISEGTETPVGTAVSGTDGSYKIDQILPGNYVLSTEAPKETGNAVVAKNMRVVIAADSVKDVRFRATSKLHGAITIHGLPASQQGINSAEIRSTSNELESFEVQIQPDGTFDARLEPGSYDVAIEGYDARRFEVPETEGVFTTEIQF